MEERTKHTGIDIHSVAAHATHTAHATKHVFWILEIDARVVALTLCRIR